jgi:hypothetical protein
MATYLFTFSLSLLISLLYVFLLHSFWILYPVEDISQEQLIMNPPEVQPPPATAVVEPPPRFYDVRVSEKGNLQGQQGYKLFLRPTITISDAMAVLFRKYFSVVKGRSGAPLPPTSSDSSSVNVGELTADVDDVALQGFMHRICSIKCCNTELVGLLGYVEATLSNLDSISSPISTEGMTVFLGAALPSKKTVNPLQSMMANALVRTKFLPLEDVAVPLLNDQVQGVLLAYMESHGLGYRTESQRLCLLKNNSFLNSSLCYVFQHWTTLTGGMEFPDCSSKACVFMRNMSSCTRVG